MAGRLRYTDPVRRAALFAGVLALLATGGPRLSAQQVPTLRQLELTPIPTGNMSVEEIRAAIEKIKKGRTLNIVPAQGTDDSQDLTILVLENKSPFDLLVLIAGPVTFRADLRPDAAHYYAIEPGAYELAVTVVGKNVPPFYGTQRLTAKTRFRHQFVIPIA